MYRQLFLGALLAILTVLFGIALLSLSGWFISTTAYISSVAALAWSFNYFLPSAGVRVFSLGRILSRYGERVVSHQATFKLLSNVRVWFYQKLEPLAPAHLMQYQSGDLLARMVGDVDALDDAYLRVLVPSVVLMLCAIVALFFFAYFSWKIALLVFATSLLAGFVMPLLTGWLSRKTSKQLSEQQAYLKNALVKHVQGLAELKTFQQDQDYFNRFAQTNEKFFQHQKTMNQFASLSAALMTWIMGGLIVVVVWLAARLVNLHELNGAMIALLALGVMALFEAIRPLPVAYQYLGKTVQSAKRVLDITQQIPQVFFPEAEIKQINDASITFNHVCFAYRHRTPVVQDFNLQIKAGEKIAIVGHTGAGKTTLVQLLARFWDLSQGGIQLGGVDIRELTENQLRHSMAFLSQQPHIFNASIRENLLLANEAASNEQLWHALENTQLKTFVESLEHGLDSWVGEHGQHLSGGQQKRLALARVYLNDAPIIVLDEPTEGLDRETENQVFDTLLHWADQKTMILVTHNPRLLSHMDRVVEL